MVEFLRDYSVQLVAILLAVAAYPLGLFAYFKQKEYELVRQRYLYEGCDQLASDIEHAHHVEMELFQRAMNLLKQFRDADTATPKALFSELRPRLDMGRLRTGTSYRLQTLTGSDSFWKGMQQLYVRTRAFEDFFDDEFKQVISELVEGIAEHIGTREKFIADCETLVLAHHARLERFYGLRLAIQNIGAELEGRRFSLREIGRFRKRKAVRHWVEQAATIVEEAKKMPLPAAEVLGLAQENAPAES